MGYFSCHIYFKNPDIFKNQIWQVTIFRILKGYEGLGQSWLTFISGWFKLLHSCCFWQSFMNYGLKQIFQVWKRKNPLWQPIFYYEFKNTMDYTWKVIPSLGKLRTLYLGTTPAYSTFVSTQPAHFQFRCLISVLIGNFCSCKCEALTFLSL